MVDANANPAAIVDRAMEVHDSINDVLSELRSNILLVQGLVEELAKGDSSESSRIMAETVETLVGNAEDAKGALRRLKELVEFGA